MADDSEEPELRRRHAAGEVRASLQLAALLLSRRFLNAQEGLEILARVVQEDKNRRAAAKAKSMLADAFLSGHGGLNSAETARAYYIDAAEQGEPGAIYGLGCWYEGSNPDFRSRDPDYDLAAHFFEAGWNAGSLACAKALARLHLAGHLRHSSRRRAVKLLTAAAACGDLEARQMLTKLGGEPPSGPRARTAAAAAGTGRPTGLLRQATAS